MIIPKLISFNFVVVVVSGFFFIFFQIAFGHAVSELAYFPWMYFRSVAFKTNYLPKGYIMYLRLKMQVEVRNSSKELQKDLVLVFSVLFRLSLAMLCATLLTSLHAVGCCSCNSLLGSSRHFHQIH